MAKDGPRRGRVEVERWAALLKSGQALGLVVVCLQLLLVLILLSTVCN